jgi:hypothetical protein
LEHPVKLGKKVTFFNNFWCLIILVFIKNQLEIVKRFFYQNI